MLWTRLHIMKRDNMNTIINISSENAKVLQATAPNLLIIVKMHFHVCLIFLIYREKTNTMLSTNCFSDLLYKVKWAEKKTPSELALSFSLYIRVSFETCWTMANSQEMISRFSVPLISVTMQLSSLFRFPLLNHC